METVHVVGIAIHKNVNKRIRRKNSFQMKIAVLGATGGTGKEVVKQALAKGHQVTALCRNPDKLEQAANLMILEGSVLDEDKLNECFTDCEVVVCSLGGGTICSQAQPLINRAIDSQKVKKQVVVTSMGVGDSYNDLDMFTTALVTTVLRNAIHDKNIQENTVKESAADWTILRPGGLTNTNLTGVYRLQEHGLGGGRVSRADVAHAIVEKLIHLDSDFSRKSFTQVY
jgi:putative NADH-flavin reductase